MPLSWVITPTYYAIGGNYERSNRSCWWQYRNSGRLGFNPNARTDGFLHASVALSLGEQAPDNQPRPADGLRPGW